MFWYISEEKLDALHVMKEKKSFWPKTIELTLKEPFTSSEVKLGNDTVSKLAERLQQVEKIYQSGTILPYEQLSGDVLPQLCTFCGVASRLVDQNAFWVALQSNGMALLLVGSATNAIGAHRTESEHISPSADPITAVRVAFGKTDAALLSGATMPLERRLSYAWQVVWNAKGNALALPKVSGIAVLANMYSAHKGEMRRAHAIDVNRLIVASPVFVRQRD